MFAKIFKLLVNILVIILPLFFLYFLLNEAGFTPLLTNSLSFDAKIEHLNQQKSKHVYLLGLGSSITLNNLNSQILADSLTHSYYNLSSWGLQMVDLNRMAQYYVPIVKPHYILIVSTVTDFRLEENETIKNYINTPEYLKRFRPYFYYENYNPFITLLQRKRQLNNYKGAINDYASLNFDKYGGVMLKIPRQNISADRWDIKTPFPTKNANFQYSELNSLAKYLDKTGVKLIFVQSPVRQSYVKRTKPSVIMHHHNKCENIVKSNHGIYIDLSSLHEYTDDHLFVDQFHFTEEGATLLTNKLVSQIKRRLNSI